MARKCFKTSFILSASDVSEAVAFAAVVDVLATMVVDEALGVAALSTAVGHVAVLVEAEMVSSTRICVEATSIACANVAGFVVSRVR
jgi:hypothetical protein